MNYYLSLAALVPAVILFVRIYQLDRIEKEPRRLLGILLLSGALLALPAAGIQLLASRTLGSALNQRSAVFLLLDNFLVVAVQASASAASAMAGIFSRYSLSVMFPI